MKRAAFMVLAITTFFLYACNSGKSSKEEASKSYQETKENLLNKEQGDPIAFLSVKGNSKKNLLGQTVVRGAIESKATLATYKDVELLLSFYSKTRALLDKEKETIYVEVSPGQSEKFKTKYFAPKGTDSVGITILQAKIKKPK